MMEKIVIIILLLIPMLPTLWAVTDIAYKDFGSLQRKALWGVLVVLLPCIGGIIYFFFGRRKGKKQEA
ncbi:MAG: PLD nuclease N-terminal domain-containing protein [Deltaproteobacteria bacterium]|jgi:hypothetical protein|nr:PLD nuclease N-terminal domain-containing protein [Deltaproteobacteria bacterium]